MCAFISCCVLDNYIICFIYDSLWSFNKLNFLCYFSNNFLSYYLTLKNFIFTDIIVLNLFVFWLNTYYK